MFTFNSYWQICFQSRRANLSFLVDYVLFCHQNDSSKRWGLLTSLLYIFPTVIAQNPVSFLSMAYLAHNSLVFLASVALPPTGIAILLIINLQSWLHIQILVGIICMMTHTYRIRIIWSEIWVVVCSKSPTGNLLHRLQLLHLGGLATTPP